MRPDTNLTATPAPSDHDSQMTRPRAAIRIAVLIAAVACLALALVARAFAAVGRAAAGEWLGAQPGPLQAVAVVVAGDVIVYWYHRLSHSVGWLWAFHRVHHRRLALDWLAAHREHPVDGLLTQIAMNLPALVLGVGLEGLAWLIVFRGVWAAFIHSNVRLPLGPLRYLVGAPELHHWHHANVPRTLHNFSNLAPWTDIVFGTYHCPA